MRYLHTALYTTPGAGLEDVEEVVLVDLILLVGLGVDGLVLFLQTLRFLEVVRTQISVSR